MSTRGSIIALCLLAGCDVATSTTPDAAILCPTGQVVDLAGACVAQCANTCVSDSDCTGEMVCLSTDGGCTQCVSVPYVDAGPADAGDAGPGDAGPADAGDAGSQAAGDAGAADAGDGGLADAGDGG